MRRYEFYLLVVKTNILRTSAATKILFSPREDKIHIFKPPCNVSSIIKADRAGFLGRRKGTAGRRKPPQGAALISMREHRVLIGRKAYVHPVTYAMPVS